MVTAATTKYRDLNFLVVFGVQLIMYVTPIIYPLSKVPEKYQIFRADKSTDRNRRNF